MRKELKAWPLLQSRSLLCIRYGASVAAFAAGLENLKHMQGPLEHGVNNL